MPKEAFFSLFNKSQKWWKIVKKLRSIFKVNFLENYTSNEGQIKLKKLYKA